MVSDTLKDVGEVGLGVDAEGLARRAEAQQDHQPLGCLIVAGKERVVASLRDRSQSLL